MFAKKFLVISISCFISMVIAYAWLVDNLVIIERSYPYSYKQFLLQSSAQIKGKVIIESGSNSIYGIEPFELSEYFNAPVLTIANNAGYPLRPKIFNIEKFVQQGDIVLLALEWNQYAASKKLPDDFISALADKDLRYEFYFNNLPFWEQLKFIFTEYPLYYMLAGMKQRLFAGENINAKDLHRLADFKTLLNTNSNASFGNSNENIPGKPIDNSQYVSCDEYLFYKGFIISDVFKNNLLLLKKLVRKGVAVYFIWPSVVDKQGSDCYQDARISRYADEIKALVASEGLQFIGDYQQSRAPYPCFLNTYYHITHDCAITRTKGLIKEFQALQIGKVKASNTKSDFKTLSNEYLNKAILGLKHKLAYRHPVDRIGHINLAKQISLIKGWHKLEDWGVWSQGKASVLNFEITRQLATKKFLKLRIRGAYYNGSIYSQTAKTRVEINGVSLGEHVLTDKTLNIPASLITNKQINIQFNYLTDKGEENMQFGLVGIDIVSATKQKK